MSGKYALVIANTEYTDPGLAQLSAPGKDAKDFAHILSDPEIGAFDDVKVLLNQVSSSVIEAIDEFFNQKKPDDLIVLYFSGHGVRDELGALYLAVKNTIRVKLRSTAIKSDYIREVMDQSRSKRQLLILDCCNSGAFAQGTKAATGTSIGTASAFEAGYGRIILTASDSTQFAWEGDKVIGETDNSLFTHYLVEGLKGEADLDGDGCITVDELYDYAYTKVKLATPKQTPSKFSAKQQGEIILRQNIQMQDIKPAPLPEDLVSAMNSSLPYVREAAVRQLEELLKGKNRRLARSAREALEFIAGNDDSRSVSHAASQAMETIRQAQQADDKVKLEAERFADEKQRAKKVEKGSAELAVRKVTEKAAREEPERNVAEKRASKQTEKGTRALTENGQTQKQRANAEKFWRTNQKLILSVIAVVILLVIGTVSIPQLSFGNKGAIVSTETIAVTSTNTPAKTPSHTITPSKTLVSTATSTSTPTRLPTPGGQLVLEETFEKGNIHVSGNGYSIVDDGTGNKILRTNGDSTRLDFGPKSFQYGTIEFSYKPYASDITNGFWCVRLNFRRSSMSSTMLDIYSMSNLVGLNYWSKDSGEYSWQDMVSIDFSFHAEQWHTVQTRVSETTIQMYLDKEFVLDYPNNKDKSGNIGIEVFPICASANQCPPATVFDIDDIKIWTP